MSYKTFKCVICGDEVSRRKSFSFKNFTGKDERACRHHPEVQCFVQEAKELEMARKASEGLLVISVVAQVRVLYSFFGFSVEYALSRMRANGYSAELIRKVREEIEREGGPKISPEEITTSILLYRSAANRA